MFARKNDLSSLKIGDFGLASSGENTDFKFAGTVTYMSPEQLRGQSYDCKVDIFAAGFVVYVLCSGGAHPVYRDGDSKENYAERLLSLNNWDFPRYFPTLARNLFFNSVKFDRNVRYQALECLKHPFVTRETKKIPNSLIEEYAKQRLLKQFKGV